MVFKKFLENVYYFKQLCVDFNKPYVKDYFYYFYFSLKFLGYFH